MKLSIISASLAGTTFAAPALQPPRYPDMPHDLAGTRARSHARRADDYGEVSGGSWNRDGDSWNRDGGSWNRDGGAWRDMGLGKRQFDVLSYLAAAQSVSDPATLAYLASLYAGTTPVPDTSDLDYSAAITALQGSGGTAPPAVVPDIAKDKLKGHNNDEGEGKPKDEDEGEKQSAKKPSDDKAADDKAADAKDA